MNFISEVKEAVSGRLSKIKLPDTASSTSPRKSKPKKKYKTPEEIWNNGNKKSLNRITKEGEDIDQYMLGGDAWEEAEKANSHFSELEGIN
jgi:hypothetical protein